MHKAQIKHKAQVAQNTNVSGSGFCVFGLYLCFGFCALVFSLLFAFAATARAQINSELLLTWEAQNYAPPEYVGRHPATPGSVVHVSAELVAGGKIQNTNAFYFSWYMDGNLLQRGAGIKEITFPIQKTRGDNYVIRAVTRFGGADAEGFARVPVARPEVVIRVAETSARAHPYFFAVPFLDSLRVSWSLQDVRQSILSAAQEFIFNIAQFQGKEARISARVWDPARTSEWREETTRINAR